MALVYPNKGRLNIVKCFFFISKRFILFNQSFTAKWHALALNLLMEATFEQWCNIQLKIVFGLKVGYMHFDFVKNTLKYKTLSDWYSYLQASGWVVCHNNPTIILIQIAFFQIILFPRGGPGAHTSSSRPGTMSLRHSAGPVPHLWRETSSPRRCIVPARPAGTIERPGELISRPRWLSGPAETIGGQSHVSGPEWLPNLHENPLPCFVRTEVPAGCLEITPQSSPY